jgi:transposase
LGRPLRQVSEAKLASVAHLSTREAATTLGLSKSFVAKWRLSRRVRATAELSPRLAEGFDGE